MSAPLWAPWRMEYILGPKSKDTCIFCEYAALPSAGLADSFILARTADAYVVLNRYPFAAGHLLVIPHGHESDLSALSDAQADALFRLARTSARLLKDAVGAAGLNIGLNLGTVAGAGVAEHLHVHIVPRWAGDTNFMPVIGDVRVMPQHLRETYEHLLPYFQEFSSGRA